MKGCEKVHEEYDKYANGQVQLGRCPIGLMWLAEWPGTSTGGHYGGLPQACRKFGQMLRGLGTEEFAGPPGDVHVYDPEDHEGPAEEKMITILWAPLKD